MAATGTRRDGGEFASVVVGLGAIGSAAAYWLARRLGDGVLGLEQFELGHGRGASEDHSRIVRRSYHTPGYVRLAGEALRVWREVEAEADERLVLPTGGLDLWPPGAAIAMEDYTASLSAAGVAFEELDAAEVVRRWPPWRLHPDTAAVFQADGGLAAASRCNAAHRRLAVEHGATIRERTRVTALRPDGDAVAVEIDDGTTLLAGTAIVAADAWTNELLAPLGAALPLTVTQEQVVYLGAADPAEFAPERFPVWIWMDDPSFYGLPVFGERGPKIGQDVGGREVNARTRTFEVDRAALGRVEAFVAEYLPGAAGAPLAVRTCLYTMPPDRDLIIGPLPGHPRVLVAQGAAHAFKFCSLLGRILAELAVEGSTQVDLEAFRLDRTALSDPEAPRSFLV